MNRAIFLIGHSKTGKSFIARELKKGYQHSCEITRTNPFSNNPFMVSEIPELIIADDMPLNAIQEMIPFIKSGVRIRKLYENVREVKPDWIFTFDGDFETLKRVIPNGFPVFIIELNKMICVFDESMKS